MRAVPKRWLHSGLLRTIPGPDGTVWIECELIAPPSREGQGVDLYLSVEDVTALLLELRQAAILVRSTPLPDA